MLVGPRLLHFMLFSCLALVSVDRACGQSRDETWTVVYIGDSTLPIATRVYAEKLKEEFGVDVFVTQRGTGYLEGATRMLQSHQGNVIRDAKVVVVAITISNDRPGYCTDTNGDQPFNTETEALSVLMDHFLANLTSLADPETALILIANEQVVPAIRELLVERSVEEQCIQAFQRINADWSSAAAKYGVTLVDFFETWHGPDGKSQPPRSFYLPDGVHLSNQGAEAAAALLGEAATWP